MKKRLKKKLNTPSVKFKHKVPVKHKFHKWMVKDIYNNNKFGIAHWHTVTLRCQICARTKIVMADPYQIAKLKKYTDNYWVFSNINHVVGRD